MKIRFLIPRHLYHSLRGILQTQVQDRVRFPATVRFRAAFHLKPHPGIKTHGLPVLLVHGHSLRVNILDRPLDKITTDALSPVIRIHEKHLDRCHVIPQKGYNFIPFIMK